jgi:hypothetical protein
MVKPLITWSIFLATASAHAQGMGGTRMLPMLQQNADRDERWSDSAADSEIAYWATMGVSAAATYVGLRNLLRDPIMTDGSPMGEQQRAGKLWKKLRKESRELRQFIKNESQTTATRSAPTGSTGVATATPTAAASELEARAAIADTAREVVEMRQYADASAEHLHASQKGDLVYSRVNHFLNYNLSADEKEQMIMRNQAPSARPVSPLEIDNIEQFLRETPTAGKITFSDLSKASQPKLNPGWYKNQREFSMNLAPANPDGSMSPAREESIRSIRQHMEGYLGTARPIVVETIHASWDGATPKTPTGLVNNDPRFREQMVAAAKNTVANYKGRWSSFKSFRLGKRQSIFLTQSGSRLAMANLAGYGSAGIVAGVIFRAELGGMVLDVLQELNNSFSTDALQNEEDAN